MWIEKSNGVFIKKLHLLSCVHTEKLCVPVDSRLHVITALRKINIWIWAWRGTFSELWARRAVCNTSHTEHLFGLKHKKWLMTNPFVNTAQIWEWNLINVFEWKFADENECDYLSDLCEIYSQCFNTIGSYYCQCLPGFTNIRGLDNFTAYRGPCVGKSVHACVCVCVRMCERADSFSYPINLIHHHMLFFKDINECLSSASICGPVGTCMNLIGRYECICPFGYTNNNRSQHQYCTGKCSKGVSWACRRC